MQMHCNDHQFGHSYKDLATAVSACVHEPNCSGIYDNQCNGKRDSTDFKMCDGHYDLQSSTSSCVYVEAPGT